MGGFVIIFVAWQKGDRSAVQTLLEGAYTLGATMSPITVDSTELPLLGTVSAIRSNYDTYQGRPIVSEREQLLPPEQQGVYPAAVARIGAGAALRLERQPAFQ